MPDGSQSFSTTYGKLGSLWIPLGYSRSTLETKKDELGLPFSREFGLGPDVGIAIGGAG
jgi:hypothetical protein